MLFWKKDVLYKVKGSVFPGKNKHSEDLRFISAFPNNAGKEELIYNRAPEAMDFNYQCNEKDIVEDTRQVKT